MDRLDGTARVLAHQYAIQYGSKPSDDFLRHAAVGLAGSAALDDKDHALPGDCRDFDPADARRERESAPGTAAYPSLDRGLALLVAMTGRQDAGAVYDPVARETYWRMLGQVASHRAEAAAAPRR